MYKLTSGLESVTNTTSIEGENWYHECNRNSDHLLITAGDSWTWGGSLDPTKRTELIYGQVLSNKKNYDWINVGLSGESNLVIKDYVSKVFDSLTKKYKSITIIFTLTESTRDLTSLNFAEDNYNNIKGDHCPDFVNLNHNNMSVVENEFPNSHIVDVLNMHLALQYCRTIQLSIAAIEEVTVDCIKHAFPSTVKLVLARNFTSWSDISNSTVPETWTENIARNGKLPAYPQDLLFGTIGMGADNIVAYQDKFNRLIDFKQDLLNHLDNTETAINWLVASPYNSSKATKHPLAEAHSWWADHLYKLDF
jgi:hypothetical protein